MIITYKDPATMTTQERLSEIAALLARGYLRLSSKRERNCLEPDRAVEPHCYTVVNDERAGSNVEAVA